MRTSRQRNKNIFQPNTNQTNFTRPGRAQKWCSLQIGKAIYTLCRCGDYKKEQD